LPALFGRIPASPDQPLLPLQPQPVTNFLPHVANSLLFAPSSPRYSGTVIFETKTNWWSQEEAAGDSRGGGAGGPFQIHFEYFRGSVTPPTESTRNVTSEEYPPGGGRGGGEVVAVSVGVAVGPAADVCGVCGGIGATCSGCDGVPSSGLPSKKPLICY
jgi:hypothetical protein